MSRRARLLAAAKADLVEIALWIGAEAQDVGTAKRFIGRLRAYCDELASLPGTLGRARDDLGPDLRSAAWRGYAIVFRYEGGRLQVVRIIQGQRDLPAQFPPTPES